MQRRRKLQFTAAVLVGPLLLAEGLVRVTKPHTDLWALTGRAEGPDPKASWADVDAFCAYRARPGRYEGLGGDAKVKTVNQDGFISTPEVPRERATSSLRVAFLGESSCAGTGHDPVLADEETWPWQVAERLRGELDRPVDFLNAAASGYTTFESLGRLQARVRFYRPDALVIYHGWNELNFAHPDELTHAARWRVLDDGSWALRAQVPLVQPRRLDHLIWASQLLTKLRLRLRAPGGEIPAYYRPVPDCDLRAVELWRENLRLLLAAARALEIEAFVCIQPTLMVPDLSPADRARCHSFEYPYEAHLRAWAAYRAVVRELVPPERVIDASHLDGRADLFHDHVHPTAEGATQVARVVAQALLPWARDRGT